MHLYHGPSPPARNTLVRKELFRLKPVLCWRRNLCTLQLCVHQWRAWPCLVCATFLFSPHFLKQLLWYRTEEMHGNLESICLSAIRHSQYAHVAFFFLVFVDRALWKQEGQSFPWCLGKTPRSVKWKICCCCWVSWGL